MFPIHANHSTCHIFCFFFHQNPVYFFFCFVCWSHAVILFIWLLYCYFYFNFIILTALLFYLYLDRVWIHAIFFCLYTMLCVFQIGFIIFTHILDHFCWFWISKNFYFIKREIFRFVFLTRNYHAQNISATFWWWLWQNTTLFKISVVVGMKNTCIFSYYKIQIYWMNFASKCFHSKLIFLYRQFSVANVV